MTEFVIMDPAITKEIALLEYVLAHLMHAGSPQAFIEGFECAIQTLRDRQELEKALDELLAQG